jgi:hypothetical protein
VLFVLAKLIPKISLKLPPQVLVTALFSMCVSMFAVLAPGNAARQMIGTNEAGQATIASATSNTFLFGILSIPAWITPPVLLSVLLLIPFFIKITKNVEFKFRYPLVAVVLSFLAYSTLPFLNFVGYYEYVPGRVSGVLNNFFIILLMLNVFYFTGWLTKKYLVRKPSERGGIAVTAADRIISFCREYALPCFIVLSFLTLLYTVNIYQTNPFAYSTTSVLSDINSGRAEQYYREYSERLAVLQDPGVSDVEFSMFSIIAPSLYYRDLTFNPDDMYLNRALADFYNKSSIVIVVDNTPPWERIP